MKSLIWQTMSLVYLWLQIFCKASSVFYVYYLRILNIFLLYVYVQRLTFDRQEKYFLLIRPVRIDENDAVRKVINNSLHKIQHVDEDTIERNNCPTNVPTEHWINMIKEYADKCVTVDQHSIVVSGLSIWSTAQSYIRKSGFLQKSGLLNVIFASFENEEDASDLVGPKREFFHILLGGIARDSGALISKGFLFIS